MSERPRPLKKESNHTPNAWTEFGHPTPLAFTREQETSIKELFATDTEPRDWQAEYQLALLLYEKKIKRKAPQQAIQLFLNAMFTLSILQRPYQGETLQSTAKMNTLQAHWAELLAIDHAQGVQAQQILTGLQTQYDQLLGNQQGHSKQENELNSWYVPKLFGLLSRFERWQRTDRFIQLMAERTLGVSFDESSVDLRSAREEIWKQVMADQTYQLRSAFFPSQLFLPPDQVIHIIDPSLLEQEALYQHGYYAHPQAVALFGIGAQPEPDSQVGMAGTPVQLPYNVHYVRTDIQGIHAVPVAVLGPDGQFYASADTAVPLQRGFESRGQSGLYELVTLFLVMRVHDLVKPAEYVDRLPSIESAEREASAGDGATGQNKDRTLRYSRLVLPRTKPMPPAEGENLQETVPSSDPEATKRVVKPYHVGWFVRPLPRGYRVSPQAVARAASVGITLKPGETFVKEHDRAVGEGGAPAPNRPRKVSGS